MKKSMRHYSRENLHTSAPTRVAFVVNLCLRCETAEPWEVQTNLARHHARINNMKPTVKTRGRRGPGPPRRKRASLPGISPQSKGGRHSLPGGKRRTPKKAAAERPHKTSPELAQLPELEHRMVQSVQSSSAAIAELKAAMGVPQSQGRRPPRYPSASTGGGSARGAPRADPPRRGGAARGAQPDGEDLRSAYELLLERTDVLAGELEQLRSEESSQAAVPLLADGSTDEVQRLRSLISGLERGVQTSSEQLEGLRRRFDAEVEAKAAELEAEARRTEQQRVAELEAQLRESAQATTAAESALADLDAAESSDADGDAVAVGTGEVNSLRVAWVSALERRNANAMVKLFGPGGRLQGSLATEEATEEGGAAAMVTGADGLLSYFKAFFKQYPLLKVEGGGLKQPVAPGAVQQIADSTAVWSTSAELHLYEHPQDVTCKVARVSFVFTLGRPTAGGELLILLQNCVVKAERKRTNDGITVGAKPRRRPNPADAEAASGKQHLETRAERQAAQKKRREEVAARRHQAAMEAELALQEQEKAQRRAIAARKRRKAAKRQERAEEIAAETPPKTGNLGVKGSEEMEQRQEYLRAKALHKAAQNSKTGLSASPPKSGRSHASASSASSSPRSSRKHPGRQAAVAQAEEAAAREKERKRELAREKKRKAERAAEQREMDAAARRLQARQRGRVARRQVAGQKREMHGAASMLQARQRGRVARRGVAQQRREMNDAASALQARQRGRLARRQAAQERARREAAAAVEAAREAAQEAAAAVAAAQADDDDEEDYEDDYEDDFSDDFESDSGFDEESNAPVATPHAGDWAAEQARDEATDQHEMDAAARKLQARQRGRAARRQVSQQRREMHGAASALQARQRGRRTRRQLAEARSERLQQESAARRIQARHRGKLARKDYTRRRDAVRAHAVQPDEEEAYEDDYEDDFSDGFSDLESEEDLAATPPPDDSAELDRAARRIQARQRGKRARAEMREQHHAAAKMQAVHRGRAARQAAKQRRAAEAVAAAQEASALAAALVEVAKEGEDDGYSDEDFDDDFDDESLDADELWADMENATSAPAPAPAPAPMPAPAPAPAPPPPAAIMSPADTTGAMMDPEDLDAEQFGLPAVKSVDRSPAILGGAANDDGSDGSMDFGSFDAEELWDQPVMRGLTQNEVH